MTVEEFKDLEVDNYFHDPLRGDEWKIISVLDSEHECVCTKPRNGWVLSQVTTWDYDDAHNFTKGRHPDNLPKEAQELFVNVYSFEGGFEVGHLCHKTMEEAHKAHIGDGTYLYTAKLVPVEIQQPFVPKHGEKCKFENLEGDICKCTPIEIKGKFHAYMEFSGGIHRLYCPRDIKQFLPL
jgi:hypothetical protein